MNYLIPLLFFTLSFSSHATSSTHVSLSYEFGNQVTRSQLTVLSNGLVMKSESVNGKSTYLADEQLSEKDSKILHEHIEKSLLSAPVQKEDIPASLGGFYGDAKVFSEKGYSAILYTLSGNEDLNTKSVVCQAGEYADEVRKFIQDRVRDKMPLTTIPCQE